jgi:hypothetical protein
MWDSLLIAFGLLLGLVAVANEVVFARYGFNHWADVVSGILIPGNWLAWCAAFVLPFGRDLITATEFHAS